MPAPGEMGRDACSLAQTSAATGTKSLTVAPAHTIVGIGCCLSYLPLCRAPACRYGVSVALGTERCPVRYVRSAVSPLTQQQQLDSDRWA